MNKSLNRNLTVVTVAKNHQKGIVATSESLVNQDFKNWHLIFVVARSQDSSIPTAMSISEKDPRCSVIVQTNTGIYEAMNLGLESTKDKYVWFMNAGDTFFGKSALSKSLAYIESTRSDAIIGGYLRFRRKNNYLYRPKNEKAKLWKINFNPNSSCHQAMVFKTSKLNEMNKFSTKFGMSNDFEMISKLIKGGQVFTFDEILCIVEPGGGAELNLEKVREEKLSIYESLEKNKLLIFLLKVEYKLIGIFFFLKKLI